MLYLPCLTLMFLSVAFRHWANETKNSLQFKPYTLLHQFKKKIAKWLHEEKDMQNVQPFLRPHCSSRLVLSLTHVKRTWLFQADFFCNTGNLSFSLFCRLHEVKKKSAKIKTVMGASSSWIQLENKLAQFIHVCLQDCDKHDMTRRNMNSIWLVDDVLYNSRGWVHFALNWYRRKVKLFSWKTSYYNVYLLFHFPFSWIQITIIKINLFFLSRV